MSSYYREQGYGSRKRFLRHLRFLWLLLVVGLLVAGAFIGYDAYKQMKRSNEASVESKTETSLIVADSQLVTTPYFQFQSSKKWKAIANESRSNHFVYRQYNGPLVEQEIVIEINQGASETLALVQTSHVLPVTVSANGKLNTDAGISPHCRDIIKPLQSNNPISTTYKNVRVNCNPQTTRFIAVVGLAGSTTSMLLPRPDGSKATYNITYRNLTAQPTIGDFDNIVETFETR